MRFHFVTAALLALGLAACETTPTENADDAPSAAMRLETQADMAAVAGKRLTLEAGKSYVIGADGTIMGSWDGAPLVGTYEMKDGFFCRTLSQGPNGPSGEDCQVLSVEDTTLIGTRNRGEGATFRLTIS